MMGRKGWQETRSALFVCAGLGAGGFLLAPFTSFASAIPLFVCALLFIALRMPLRVALAASVAATLTLDFYFVDPRHTLRVFSAQDVASLCCFLVSTSLISRLTNRLTLRTAQWTQQEAAQVAVYSLAQRALSLDWQRPIAQELCRAVRECFRLERVCIWDALEERFVCDGDSFAAIESTRAAFMANQDYDLPKSRTALRILRSGVRPVGSIEMQGDGLSPAVSGAIATLISLAMERTHALRGEILAQSESASEQLRSAVLDGLAHAIKTPLTTIAVASAGIGSIGTLSDAQTNLLGLVQAEIFRITRLTNRLLRTASFETKTVVKLSQVSLSDLVANAVHAVGETERFYLDEFADRLTISTDPELLQMAVNQLAENAVQYGSPDTMVTVTTRYTESALEIAVHNDGSLVAPNEHRLIFNRFYRSPSVQHSAPGTGLGLSVAQKAVEALGGRITLHSDVEAGTTFTIHLPTDLPTDLSSSGAPHAGFSTHRRR